MAALNKAKLVREAKKQGYTLAQLRGKSAQEIQELLSGGNRPVKKKSTAGRARKKTTTTRARKSTTRRGPGRPRKSTTRKTTARASRNNGQVRSTDGRHVLKSTLNFKKKNGWNPREGSAPDRIVKALARFGGDREKVFKNLLPDIKEFVGQRRGKRYTKAEAEQMLRYRISRTAWQFALATNQHQVATDRAEYGKGGTGEGIFKRQRSKSKPAATARKKSTTRSTSTRKKATARAQSTTSNGRVDPKAMTDAALKKYLKGFQGKRGRRPAEFKIAEREARKRRISV